MKIAFSTEALLAALSEGGKTTADLVEAFGGKRNVVKVTCGLYRLKKVGKITSEAKGGPWRLVKEGASPPREEEEPSPPAGIFDLALGADDLQGRALAILKRGPAALSDVVRELGEPTQATLKALRCAATSGRAHVEGRARAARWSLGVGEEKPPKRQDRKAPRHYSASATVNGLPLDARSRLLLRKRELEFARDLALARLEECEQAIEAVS